MFRSLAGPTPRSCALSLPRDKRSCEPARSPQAATRVTDGFSGATYNSGAKAAALSIFRSTKQRFFGQILLSMKLPSLIPAIAADLARGDCAVVQLVSTSEAMLDRALADLSPRSAPGSISSCPRANSGRLSDGGLSGAPDAHLYRR
jgi:hypothetical protein